MQLPLRSYIDERFPSIIPTLPEKHQRQQTPGQAQQSNSLHDDSMDRIRNLFDNVSAFFHSPLFNFDFKNKMHLIQVTLVITMIILTGARVGIKPSGMPVTRSDTLGIVMVG